MSHPKLLISAPFFTPDELARVEAVAPSVLAGTPEERAALPEGLRAGITAMANKGHKPIDGAQMDLFPNLEVIAQFGVGYDAIDVAAATERGIRVTNTPDVLNEDVADLALAMMLGWCREIIKGDAWVRDGTWDTGESMPLNRKMSGAPVGIAGMGRIGRAIADRCAGFGMEVHYTSRSEKETPEGWVYHGEDVVAMADAVEWLVVAVVGGEHTKGYVSKEAIKALGPRGVVINIARGTCIDEEALIEALETGEIAGAGLDVFYNEPHVDPRLIALPNVLLQPHQASATVETRRDMSLLQCANLSAYFAGEALLTPVN
ncbi:2-hydroxyacid dehydrogenase [Celeribacter halophilus]|uniref:2-hydroxyacid dehydrogenase n=1 Tax=Celeribacter halophilus TaxID=576117 RepID=A0AAW7XVV7_9RHOB|nr:2-hydroxyacid dehydrogenase [Celeribacter halophilus]MDO6457398.1 2-hydroxyacid dehydrogenase [Celeribacter halophilus]MDO6722149.1 2-hydroxyacid dehydrogenase [Celeribacter halophilus]